MVVIKNVNGVITTLQTALVSALSRNSVVFTWYLIRQTGSFLIRSDVLNTLNSIISIINTDVLNVIDSAQSIGFSGVVQNHAMTVSRTFG